LEPVQDLRDLHYLWFRKRFGLVQVHLQPVKTGYMLQNEPGKALHLGRWIEGREFLPDYFLCFQHGRKYKNRESQQF